MFSLPVYNPAVPFVGQIPGGFRPSLMVRLKGRTNGHGWCQLNFLNSPSLNCGQDVIFHLSIRPKDKVIVRNNMKNGQWQQEERYGHCRVKSGETFEIIILAELQHYKIAVNGHHLGVFRHRMPLSLVNYINVNGEATIDHILLEQDMKSAQDAMILSQVTSTPIGYPRMPINMPPHVIHQPQPHIQMHQQPQMSIFQPTIPGQVHTQMHVAQAYQHPTAPPPPYSSQPGYSSATTITRIGGITIEQRPGAVVVKQKPHQSHVFRF